VELEGAVGDLDHLHVIKVLDDLDHLVPVLAVGAVDGDLAERHVLTLHEDVDCADLAARLADRRGQPPERSGAAQELNPEDDRELRTLRQRAHLHGS
jgi:hypothetical protein